MLIDKMTRMKVVVVGDTCVGKTCLVSRFISNQFSPETKTTVGAACLEKEIVYNNKNYLALIWDTAGQETYRNLVPLYFRGSAVAIITIDVTSRQTLESLDFWVETVLQHCPQDIIILIAANKIDLNPRSINKEDLERVAQKYNVSYFETSSVTGEGINQMFMHALKQFDVKISKEKRNKEDVASPMSIKDEKKECC